MDAMGFIMDHMGHFSLYDVPNMLFAVLMGTLLGWLLARWAGGQSGHDARQAALWAGTMALATAFVRAQLPLAVVLLALVVLVKDAGEDRSGKAVRLGAMVLGMACGSGAALVALAIAVPYALVVRWAFAQGPRT